MVTITELEKVVNELPEDVKQIFDNIFRFSISAGHLSVPDTFREKTKKYCEMGVETEEEVCERVSSQVIVKTFNKYTLEGALFNELRACKPGNRPEDTDKLRVDVYADIEEQLKTKECDFCRPEKFTSMDLEERIRRNGHITAANLAKYDVANGIIIFKNHNPLDFTEQDFYDWMDMASEWFKSIHAQYGDLTYPYLMWNCLPRAGASQMHGHIQTLLTSVFPYEGTERLRLANERYGGNYFHDVATVHKKLGLGFDYNGGDVMVYLTPTKDKETLVQSHQFDELKEPTFKVIRCFIDKLGVFAFNLGIQMPPLVSESGWDDFRYVARVVDRGNPLKDGTDFAGMELFASKVIGSDPFKIAEVIRDYIRE